MRARLRAASLFALIAVAAVSALPKVDLPETAFDETDAPTIQAVVMTEAASSKCISSEVASTLIPFFRTRKVLIIPPAYSNQSGELGQFLERLTSLRC